MFPSIPFAPFDVAEVHRRLRDRANAAAHSRREREGLREMLALDDHALSDIGLNRGDVEYVSQLPATRDRSAILWRLSSRNPSRR